MDNKPNLGPIHDYWPSIYEHDFLEIQSLENIFQETRLIQVLAKLSFQVQKYDVIIHRNCFVCRVGVLLGSSKQQASQAYVIDFDSFKLFLAAISRFQAVF